MDPIFYSRIVSKSKAGVFGGRGRKGEAFMQFKSLRGNRLWNHRMFFDRSLILQLSIVSYQY